MNSVKYKIISRVAYKLLPSGNLNMKSKQTVYGGEIFVNGKLVKFVPIIYKINHI